MEESVRWHSAWLSNLSTAPKSPKRLSVTPAEAGRSFSVQQHEHCGPVSSGGSPEQTRLPPIRQAMTLQEPSFESRDSLEHPSRAFELSRQDPFSAIPEQTHDGSMAKRRRTDYHDATRGDDPDYRRASVATFSMCFRHGLRWLKKE